MPDDLRHRFIALLSQPLPCPVCGRTQRCRCARPKDAPSDAERRADLLLAVRDEELERLRQQVADYENAVVWTTSCTGCANSLDQIRRQEERAEKAERRRSAARDACHKAMADPDASTATLAALHHVLAALDDTTAET